jgi:hypothetical protein
MLTKWGAALGLASAGRITSGGGGNTGVPLGPFNDWSELPASAAGGSLALVADLGPASSSGLAVYDTGDGEWKLQFGTFLTLADLLTFTDPINSMALATVGTLLDDPESVRYQWDGSAWVRTPNPVEYIYAATDWADLPTQDTIQADDEAVVALLGLGNAYGRAVYDGTDWLLSRAWFDTVADMTAFPELKSVGALAAVEASASDDENAVRYQWNGSAWARTAALTAGYAWTLTETQLLTGADPSGIGAVQDGDWGTYTPSGGAPVVVRYKAACTVAAGAGGGTRPVWMIPEAYAGTPEVVAYLTGSETGVLATTLAAQGWTVTTTGSGAGQGVVSLNDGYVRCQTAASAGGGDARVISPTWLGSQRFCVQGLLRGSAGGSDPYVGLMQFNNNDIQYTFIRGNNSGVFRHFILSGASWTAVDSLNSLPNAGATPGYNLNATTPWFFQAIGRALTSATVSETVETRIDGELYGSMRRNLDSAVGATAMGLTLYSNGGGGGTTSTLDSKTLTILTY